MKNSIIKRLICLVISTVMLVSFCACGGGLPALDVPVITSVRDGYVYWDEVPGANSYVIKINGAQEEVSSALKCSIEETMGSLLIPGKAVELHISIKAKGNQVSNADSLWSDEVVISYTPGQEAVGDFEPGGSSSGGIIHASAVSRYQTKPVESLVTDESEMQTSFKDDNFWYYVFYLGDITRVPLENRQAEHFDGVLERKLSFTYSTVESETISNSASYASQKCDSWSKEISETIGEKNSTTVKAAASVKASVAMIGADISAEAAKSVEQSLEKGFVNSFSGSTSETWTESYERAHEYSETVTTSTEVTFTKDVKPGYYRYILLGTVAVYAVVIYDPETEETYVTKISDVKASYRDFDYSEDPIFESDTEYGELSFDVSRIEKFIEPLAYFGSEEEGSSATATQDGTAENPYLISTPEDFEKIKQYNGAGVHFALRRNIDFTDKEYLYSPFAEFKGVLDGHGHIIRNWTYSGNGEQIGFFMKNSGTVKNVVFENCTIAKATNTGGEILQVGIVCGINTGKIINVLVNACQLVDCHMGDTQTNTNATVAAGFIAGENGSGGSISCCGVTASTINAKANTQYKDAWVFAAGIVGRSTSSIENCYARGNTVNAETAGAERFLGLQKADIYSCAAGLVGELSQSGLLKYSIADGNRLTSTATGGDARLYAACLVSKNEGAVFNCYSLTVKSSTKPSASTETEAVTTTATATELIATGNGSKSDVSFCKAMTLESFTGFSKELWMNSEAGAVIIHENMK